MPRPRRGSPAICLGALVCLCALLLGPLTLGGCARSGPPEPAAAAVAPRAAPKPLPRQVVPPPADPGRTEAQVMAEDGPRWVTQLGYAFNGAGPYHGMEWVHYSDPDRDQVALPEAFLKILALQPGQTVADVGAGTGYFSFRVARAVGPEGKVLALELAPPSGGDPFHVGMMRYFNHNLADPERNPHRNVVAVQNADNDAMLAPESVDTVLMYQVSCLLRARSDLEKLGREGLLTIHDRQVQMVQSVYRALKPGGRLVVVDLIDDPDVPGARDLLWLWRPIPTALHMAVQVQDVQRNYEALGFRAVGESDLYSNEAYRQARAAFVSTPWHQAMVGYGVGHRMFVLVFARP